MSDEPRDPERGERFIFVVVIGMAILGGLWLWHTTPGVGGFPIPPKWLP